MRQRYGLAIGNIVHATDFSHGSDVAFAHALRLSVDAKGELEILHVDRDDAEKPDWDSYPSVRDTLSDWNLIPENSPRRAVAELGVHISKSACRGDETAERILEHIEDRGAELVVMATHQRKGIDRLVHSSMAERVSARCGAASLLIPYNVDGFVDLQTGTVSLRQVLIPISRTPSPQAAVELVGQLVDTISHESVEVRLLHIGDPADMPSLTFPTSEKCKWTWDSRVGDVTEEICNYATEYDVDLIAMTTKGHDGFLDILRGSTTERVLHQATCPVLSVHESGNR